MLLKIDHSSINISVFFNYHFSMRVQLLFVIGRSFFPYQLDPDSQHTEYFDLQNVRWAPEKKNEIIDIEIIWCRVIHLLARFQFRISNSLLFWFYVSPFFNQGNLFFSLNILQQHFCRISQFFNDFKLVFVLHFLKSTYSLNSNH